MTAPSRIPTEANRLHAQLEALRRTHSGGEPPYDGGMEARVSKLEEFAVEVRDRLARIETRMDSFVTKADLHQELHSMTWRIIGSTIGLGIALIGAMAWIVKNVS
jgi:hypothetical protein